jgi:hypothetical protein
MAGMAKWKGRLFLLTSDHGIQRTAQAARAYLNTLVDAVQMPREAFRERLAKFLRQNGFEI